MAETTFLVPTFKYGLDTRKDVLSALLGTLVTCENCHINPGGEIEGRKKFDDIAANTDVLDSNGAQGTFGIQVTDAGIVVFGSALNFGTSVTQSQPTLASALVGVTYQQLKHPSLTNDSTETYNASYHKMTAIAFSENFNGKAFACAVFADGRRFLYYDGTLIQQSANGIVMEGRTALDDLANDLARQVGYVGGWSALANRTEVTLDSITRVGTTATATYTGHGLSNGDVVEIRGAIPSQYNGHFLIFNKTANTFDYTMYSDPGASASGTIVGTIYQAGSVLIDSPGSETFSAIPSETATSGQFGFKTAGTNGTEVPGQSARACFQITANTGPFTLTAPETAAGTGSVDLCGGSVSASTSATTTASAIVAAINDLTYIHGYYATNLVAGVASINVYVFAKREWGPVTFNLTVTGATTAACAGTPSLLVSINPNTYSYIVSFPAGSVRFFSPSSPLLLASASGGTNTGFTYRWTEQTPGSGGLISIVTPTASTLRVSVGGVLAPPLEPNTPQGFSASGTFKCTVTDSGGNTGVAICAVSIHINLT